MPSNREQPPCWRWELLWQSQWDIHVAVMGRNRTLFRCIFRLRYHVQSTELSLRAELIHAMYIFAAIMSPALNGYLALQHFEHGNVVELCNGILFDFYTSLYHRTYIWSHPAILVSTWNRPFQYNKEQTWMLYQSPHLFPAVHGISSSRTCFRVTQ